MMDAVRIGDPVPLIWLVHDVNGDLADVVAPDAVTASVVRPDGVGVDLDLTHADVGVYTCDYLPTQIGRHTARCVVTGPMAGALEDAFDVLGSALGNPPLDEVRAYLGSTSATEEELRAALRAEQSAQARRCRVDPYTQDLHEALLRRVARNLAARAVPIAQFTSFEGGGTSTRVPSRDPEVARLEAPFRRRPVG